MIQLNLLPDVKIKYIKTKRNQRVVVLAASISSAIAIVILIILYLSVDVYSKNNLEKLSASITADSQKIILNKDVNKIITIQNRLNSSDGLPSLYKARINPVLIFDYLRKVSTPGVTIENVSMNYTTGLLSFSGKANSIIDGNVFYNQLLFATYTPLGSKSNILLFTNPIISGLTAPAPDAKPTDKLSYSVTTTIPTSLFTNNMSDSSINVKQQDVTKSTLDQPLFQK